MKVLARADAGWPSVIVNWLPPGIGEGDEPHRHYHRTVHEGGFVLHGELPMAEFDSLDAARGVAVLFQQGYCMDRGPGSVHGLDPRMTSAIGFTILEWRTGTGTYLTEGEAEDESVVLPALAEVDELPDSGRRGVVLDRADLRLVDTRELPSDEVEGSPGARIQPLALGADIAITAAVMKLGPGALTRRRPCSMAARARTCSMVSSCSRMAAHCGRRGTRTRRSARLSQAPQAAVCFASSARLPAERLRARRHRHRRRLG